MCRATTPPALKLSGPLLVKTALGLAGASGSGGRLGVTTPPLAVTLLTVLPPRTASFPRTPPLLTTTGRTKLGVPTTKRPPSTCTVPVQVFRGLAVRVRTPLPVLSRVALPAPMGTDTTRSCSPPLTRARVRPTLKVVVPPTLGARTREKLLLWPLMVDGAASVTSGMSVRLVVGDR